MLAPPPFRTGLTHTCCQGQTGSLTVWPDWAGCSHACVPSSNHAVPVRGFQRNSILSNSLSTTSFVFTELANTMKYGGGFLCNLVFTEWRHCISQNEVWGRVCYITLFSPSDVTAFHRIVSPFLMSLGDHVNGGLVELRLRPVYRR